MMIDRRRDQWQGLRDVAWRLRGSWWIAGLLVVWLGFGGGCSEDPASVCGTCPTDERCDTKAKKCVARCNPCEANADCENREECKENCCVLRSGEERDIPLLEPSPPGEAGIADAAPDNPPQDATPEQVCANPPCGRRCDTDDECKDALEPYCHLIKRTCVNCRDDSDCKDGKTCSESTSRCGEKSKCDGVQCSGSQSCCNDDGKCHNCCADSDCSAGESCQSGPTGKLCQPPPPCQPACATGNVCDPPTKTCKPDCRIAGCLDKTDLCDKSTGLCGKPDCRSNTTCATNEVCDQATGQCQPAPKDCRSNHTCSANEVCDQATGQCNPAPKNCNAGTLTCTKPQCCDTTSGQCVTHCRACGCATGETCNQASGVCQATACKAKTRCSSSADCCGRSCKAQTGGLGNKHCTCSSASQCQSGRCQTNFLTKYCE